MVKAFVGCSILAEEINLALKELNLAEQDPIMNIDAALHVDLDLLMNELKAKLDRAANMGTPLVLLGSKCHPEIQQITQKYKGKIVNGANCIELLLGSKMDELDQEAKTFYITNGWLKNWKEIFVQGLKWDSVDARINFGYYDRILLLDTGVTEIDDLEILEFYEYTQCPIEIIPVTLDNLKEEIQKVYY